MDNPRMKFMDEAAAKKPTALGYVAATCFCVVLVMLTIKFGMVLFT